MKKLIFFILIFYLSQKIYSQESDIFKDTRDGREYKTVKIGNQVWFAQNFAYKPNGEGFSAYDDDEKNVEIYGYLYNFETAQKICPKGWHVPSYDEWKELERSLRKLENEAVSKGLMPYPPGIQLKSQNGWYENGNGKNLVGFNALPAGAVLFYDNSFHFLTEKAYFQSSTSEGVDAYALTLSYDSNSMDFATYSKNNRMSVRYVKD